MPLHYDPTEPTPDRPLADRPTFALAFALGKLTEQRASSRQPGLLHAVAAELDRRGTLNEILDYCEPGHAQALATAIEFDRGRGRRYGGR